MNPGPDAAWLALAERQRSLLRLGLLVAAALTAVAVVLVAFAYDPEEPGWGYLGLFALVAGIPLAVLVTAMLLLRRFLATGITRALAGDPGTLRAASLGSAALAVVGAVAGLNLPLALPFVVAPAAAGFFGYLTFRALPGRTPRG